MPFYNCSYIKQAIESVINQTYPYIELIIVNDGSTIYNDLIKPYLYFPQVKYIEKMNGGTASALNEGIRNATGEIFAWLSSDDLFDSRKVEEQVTFMNQTNAAVSYTNYHLINEYGQIIHKNAGIHYENDDDFLKSLTSGCHINGCTVMANMKVFREIDLFDESLRYANDYDMWVRIAQQYVFHYLDKPLVKYRYHQSMGSVIHHNEQMLEAEIVKMKYNKLLIQSIGRGKQNQSKAFQQDEQIADFNGSVSSNLSKTIHLNIPVGPENITLAELGIAVIHQGTNVQFIGIVEVLAQQGNVDILFKIFRETQLIATIKREVQCVRKIHQVTFYFVDPGVSIGYYGYRLSAELMNKDSTQIAVCGPVTFSEVSLKF